MLIGQVTSIFANSTTRYVSINYEGVVWWQSKKQATIDLSTTMEVQYIVVAQATKEVVRLWKVISDLDFPCHNPIIFLCNNQSFNREGREQWD
jgi:hypothetical protein